MVNDASLSPFHERYYFYLAAAFCRGSLGLGLDVSDDECFRQGVKQGLRLTKFKRTMGLPRIRRVIGMLSGLQPNIVVDVGSGRGAFLWPLAHCFPNATIVAIDRAKRRTDDIGAVGRGGVNHIKAVNCDAECLPIAANSADVVTLLEVLEHLPHPEEAAKEALRISMGTVIASVPSKRDENPEHIHFFNRADIERMFKNAGARSVSTEYVLNHMIIFATT